MVFFIFLAYSFDWSTPVKRGAAEPIQAVAISEQAIVAAQEKKQAAARAAAERLEKIRRQKQQEKKRLAELKKKREQQERQRIAQEKKRKEDEAKRKAAEAERKRKAAEAERKRKEAEAKARELARIKNEAADALTALIEQIATAVENEWRRPPASRAGLVVLIEVRVGMGGAVLAAQVIKSSGDVLFDRAAENAVHRASPLPFPDNPEYYAHINKFNLKFRPDEN